MCSLGDLPRPVLCLMGRYVPLEIFVSLSALSLVGSSFQSCRDTAALLSNFNRCHWYLLLLLFSRLSLRKGLQAQKNVSTNIAPLQPFERLAIAVLGNAV